MSDGILYANGNNTLGAASGSTVVSDGAALEWQGNYTTPEPLTLTGAGPDGGGALRSTAGLVTFAGHITVPSAASIHGNSPFGGTIVLTGGIDVAGTQVTFGGAGNTTVPSLISGAGGVRKTGGGTLRVNGGATYAGATTVTGGKMLLASTMTDSAAVDVSAGATLELAAGGNVTLKTGSIAAAGRVDVKDNKVILTAQPLGTFDGTAYDGVTGQIAAGYNFSEWSGPGITTSMPAAGPTAP